MSERQKINPDFYDQRYFDPGNTLESTSNYRYYGPNKKMMIKYTLAAAHLLYEANGVPHSGTVVDLGGAKGLLASALQSIRPDLNIINSDISTYATENALPQIKQRTIQSNICAISIKNDSIDLAICMDVLEHLADIEIPGTLGEIRRIMKLGGKAILIPNIGEDHDTNCDLSHVTIRPVKWWEAQIKEVGFIIHDSLSLKLTRLLGKQKQARRIPSVRPGIFVLSK